MLIKIKGILSYPHLFTARRVDENSEPKYSVNVLIHESDPQLAQINAAVEDAKRNGFPNGFPANGKVCLKQSAEYPGYWEVRTSTGADSKPGVVDVNLQPVIDPSQVFPGCIGIVAVNTYSYSMTLSKGVAAGLNAVLITGETGTLGRLDNKPSIEQLFGDVAGSFTAPPAAPVAPPAAPVNFMAAPTLPPPPPPVPQEVKYLYNGVTYTRAQLAGWTEEQIAGLQRV